MWNLLVQNGAETNVCNAEGKTPGDLATIIKPSQ